MLTDKQCRAAKESTRPVKMADAFGLHLLILPSGTKSWRWKYRLRVGDRWKEKQLTFGLYPEVSLAEAREKRDAARKVLRGGIDPGSSGAPTAESPTTFRQAAERWLSLQKEGWKPKYAKTVEDRLAADLLPQLGDRALNDIRPQEIADLLSAVQQRGAIEVAHRLRQYASSIWDCAIALDLAETNPASPLKRALKPCQVRHQPALVTLASARAFLRALEAEPCQPATKLASRLLALTAARPGPIRWAQRDEFEGLGGDEPIWRIPAAKMKLELVQSEQDAFDFIIPLSHQAVETVEAAIAFAGRRKYLFPSLRHSHRPISENALSTNYARVPGWAGRHVPHGWRSSFSTIMNDRAAELDRPGDEKVIELMLAHKIPGVRGIYDRGRYMGRRRELAQEWADLICEGLVPATELVDGPRKRQPKRN